MKIDEINEILLQDYEMITNSNVIPWDKFFDKTVFITGVTGLIGSTLANVLLYKGNIKVIGLARSENKVKEKLIENDNLEIIYEDIKDLKRIDKNIDYIIHAAMPTSSKFFVDNPVDVIDIALTGTKRTLELAKNKNVKSYIYLSSMEIYGHHTTDEPIYEDNFAIIDSMKVRNSYPISKILCENLCVDYFCQYNVNAKIVRLAQTFGPNIEKNDNRVFAEFIRCAIENKNIILKTAGDSKRCYIYVIDAVIGILLVLLNGKNGEVYNLSNQETFCSIKEMAEMVARELTNNKIKVLIEIENKNFYPEKHSWNINSKKLYDMSGNLNQIGLKEIISRVGAYQKIT